jgi:hypothetical protein
MAHFAELGFDNTVIRVLVIPDEFESNGENWCRSLFGGIWKQTSYNGTIRKNYAGIGFKYDVTLDAFIAPKPYPSWFLNEETCKWEAPVPHPNDGKLYIWDETTKSWILSVNK